MDSWAIESENIKEGCCIIFSNDHDYKQDSLN